MTFKNLKKHKEEDKNNYSAINDTTETASIAEDKKQPFDNELLYGQWMSMCMRMQGINELYGLSQRLKMLTPKSQIILQWKSSLIIRYFLIKSEKSKTASEVHLY